MYKDILIPTDGSELAEKGIDQGLALAKALGAKATIVVVTVPLSGFALEGIVEGAAIASYDESVASDLQTLKSHIEKKAKESQVIIEFVNRLDVSPASAILDVSLKGNCDLIVMSSHGRRGIRRMMLGSQTAEVLAGSTIPVLVVK